MAKKDYSPDIRALEISVPYFSIKQDRLSPGDLKILSKTYSIYAGYCESILGYDLDPRIVDVYSFQKNVKPSEISSLISKLTELNNQEEEKEKTKEQVTSIPPELQSLVAEYEQNKTLLESEEIKSNSQKSVAEQVKIAIAHKKIMDLALANKEGRITKGEKFQKTEDILVSLGSPKSQSATEALSSSYKVVKQVAFTYSGFSKLSHEVQNEIISSAVDLNTVCVSDIDTAIQASVLQLNLSSLEEADKNILATIPGGFVSSVYHEIITENQKTTDYNTQISANEENIIKLQREGKNEKVLAIIEENQHLQAFIDEQSTRLTNKIARMSDLYKDFEKSREARLSSDPDLKDAIETANYTIASIQNNLRNNGVTPHLFTPADDAQLLEQAFRQDNPGILRPNAGYKAEYAAALINSPATQDQNLSPQAILLAGKGLTPNMIAHAREFAIKNPDSSLGKLYKTRKDLFDSIGVQIRKITSSPLGKEINAARTGLGKIIDNGSKFFGKISDKIPGGFGNAIRVIQDPFGSMRSWAGRKAGELILKRISQSLTNETLKKGAQVLLQGGLKETIKKLTAEAATKLALKVGAKVGLKLGLETAAQAANVIPGLGIVIAVAIDVLFWLGEKAGNIIKNISQSIYGEEVKARDLLAIPAAGAAAAISGVTAVVVTLSTATYIAAKSAVGTIALGTTIGIFFYITSIVMAPLISTLVQLETQPRAIVNCANMLWPFEGSYAITQGPNQISTGCTHQGGIAQSADFATPIGTPIISMSDGIVSLAGGDPGSGYGYHVVIDATSDSGQAFQIIYGHFSSVKVSTGENVKAGQTIGLSGNTGYGTGPHLHVGYLGIEYNSCPAGGFIINENCCDTSTCNQP